MEGVGRRCGRMDVNRIWLYRQRCYRQAKPFLKKQSFTIVYSKHSQTIFEVCVRGSAEKLLNSVIMPYVDALNIDLNLTGRDTLPDA